MNKYRPVVRIIACNDGKEFLLWQTYIYKQIGS
jgi:hypothetical protein